MCGVVRVQLGGRRGLIRGYAVVDKADAHLLAGRVWYLDDSGYAQSQTLDRVRLHRLLMQPGPGMTVDHINGDKLDCRQSNMRVVTQGQNSQNVRTSKGSYRGVYRDGRDGAWYGQVKTVGKRYSTGRFSTREEARLAVMALRTSLLPFSQEGR